MIENYVTKKECTGCGICEQVCPSKSITMSSDIMGFASPTIDKKSCINCKACINICPVLHRENEHSPLKTYAAFHKSESIVYQSSSGGVFTALAETVIESNGVVYGATFDNNHVKHIAIYTVADIQKLRKAKYIQSEVNSIYLDAFNKVKEGVPVLFIGTPCQATAFSNMFHEKPENLCIAEFICHGVSSEKLFQYAKKNLEKKYGSEIDIVEFHSKNRSWRSNTVNVHFKSGTNKELTSFDWPYMYGFFKNITLRESCYNCKFKNRKRSSDIVLGDFWEIKKIDSSLNNYYGVSFIAILSELGQKTLNNASKYININEVDLEKAITSKKNYLPNSYNIKKRVLFQNILQNFGYDSAEKQLLTPQNYKKVLKKIKDILLIKLKIR